jgi:hypothetical protein
MTEAKGADLAVWDHLHAMRLLAHQGHPVVMDDGLI